MRQLFSSIPGQVLDFMVVLIALVIIFKKQISGLVSSILSKMSNQANQV